MEDGTVRTLSKSADDTIPEGVVDASDIHAAIQKDIDWRNVLTGTDVQQWEIQTHTHWEKLPYATVETQG